MVAGTLKPRPHRREPAGILAQPMRDSGLQIGRRGEGEELMRLGECAAQVRRGAHPANLPAGQRKDLASRADLDAALAQFGHRQYAGVGDAIEDDMLPNLVGDHNHVVAHHKARQQFQRRPIKGRRTRVKRVVEENNAGPRRKRGFEHRRIELPVRRQQRHQHRHPAGAADERQIGVIKRLEQDDFVAGRDQRQQRRRQRLGGA